MAAMPRLQTHPVHLGQGASACIEPAFTDERWYDDYARRHAADGLEGRLVSEYSFAENWAVWEMHPHGAELVICTAGEMTLLQETADGVIALPLAAGDYAINPAGVWHSADTATGATAVFVTAGLDTAHRPR
jgi:uncharacterized protein YjlB